VNEGAKIAAAGDNSRIVGPSIQRAMMTAEEFYDWSQRWENRDRNFELEAGKVIELPLTGMREGVVCANVCAILAGYVKAIRTGHVCSNNVGLIVARNPDTVLGPDVSVFMERRKFAELGIGYLTRMPAMAIEVLSPHDTAAKMMRRAATLLDCGVAMVWLIDPEEESIRVHRLNQPVLALHGDDELTGQEILPGFCCKVADFFAMPGE
jgi:Uma2 family endonuclease